MTILCGSDADNFKRDLLRKNSATKKLSCFLPPDIAYDEGLSISLGSEAQNFF